MQHLKARQRKDGRWDYTAMHDGTIRPIGYCHAFIDPDDIPVRIPPHESERVRQFGHKHHSNGHATAEEACACYKDYVLDQRVQEYENLDMLLRCEICGTWTHHSIQIDGQAAVPICKKCTTRDNLAALFEVGESWEL